jgi:hypothetical protein
MVQGVVSRKKRYVQVKAVFDTAGKIMPTAIVWEDGRTFTIDRVKESRQATSLKVGGNGIRYLVSIMGRDTYLFYESPRWFVEEKVVEMP